MDHLFHTFSPIYDENSKFLILGTFPSVKSRENQFYYGHPQNRFWKTLSSVFEKPLPVTLEEKKEFLHEIHAAVWDVIASCDIEGSSDSSIRNVTANDIPSVLKASAISHIYTNGGTADRLYRKYCTPRISLPVTKLPSTSPANAACSLEQLIRDWSVLL